VPRIQLEQLSDEALLHLDDDTRRRLASVLADWLASYAGVEPVHLSPANFDLVVELRRVLLIPDERPQAELVPN
jgi:hypothetical protein